MDDPPSSGAPTQLLLQPQQPSRARVTRACSSCNRQKLRCDGVHPSCGRCNSLGAACEYLPSMRGKTRKRKAQAPPAASPTTSSSDKRSRPTAGGTQQPEYALWHKNSALAVNGPRNSAIWAEDDHDQPDDSTHPAGVSPVTQLSGGGAAHRERDIADRLTTTLPLPGDIHNPLAVLAQASATASGEEQPNPESDDGVAVGGEQERGYYAPLDRVLKDEAPHIMSLIDVHEAHTLFDLYHKHLHPHLPVLDVAHCAPSQVARRNNFLFNAICCVAARTFNVVLWERLREFARYETERIPKEKSLDVVQGHLIYATWNLVRPGSFEQDMTWLRLGMATRTAIDIQLHRVGHVRRARDGLPRWLLRSIARTWLMAYVADGTLSAQLGKPAAARGDIGLYISILTRDASGDDVLVASLAEWTRVLLRAVDAFRAESVDLQLASIAPDLVQVYRDQFRLWRQGAEAATVLMCDDTDPEADDTRRLLHGILRLYENYSRLIVQSFGLERALEHHHQHSAVVAVEFAEYEAAAVRLLEDFGHHLSQHPHLVRGCPDLMFTVVTYGAVSLLRTLEPRFAGLSGSRVDRAALLGLARSTADLLGRAATSPDHLPASQAAFLSRLIQVRSDEAATTNSDGPAPPLDFGELDFEAFGLDASAHDARTLWPPPPPPPQDVDQPSVDLASWLNTTCGVALPGAALGLGVGSFGTDNNNFLFPQESMW